jgi:hypothetical protein
MTGYADLFRSRFVGRQRVELNTHHRGVNRPYRLSLVGDPGQGITLQLDTAFPRCWTWCSYSQWSYVVQALYLKRREEKRRGTVSYPQFPREEGYPCYGGIPLWVTLTCWLPSSKRPRCMDGKWPVHLDRAVISR